MKLLVITSHYPPLHLGGYEIRSHNILERLQQRGYSVRVLCSNFQAKTLNPAEKEIYRVLHLEPSRNLLQRVWWDYCDLRFVWKQIQTYQPDTIYLFHTIQLARTLFPFLAKISKPLVYDEGGIGLERAWKNHGGWISFCERDSTLKWRATLRQAVGKLISAVSCNLLPYRWEWPGRMSIYFNSQSGLQKAKMAGVPLTNAKVIYSGIDIAQFPFRGRSDIQKLNIIVPGRIDPIKGVEVALLALREFIKMRPDFEFELKLIGAIVNQNYFDDLQKLLIDLGLKKNVQFIDFVDYVQMSHYYHDANICLLPTRQQEGLSRVPIEAMASGCLVISSGMEGSAEIIKNEKTGFIIDLFNPVLVARVICKLIDDPELYRKIVKEARSQVEDHFTLEKVADQIEKVLNEFSSVETQ
jgi:glycosyltransferase involved in cell wall biosynthesis